MTSAIPGVKGYRKKCFIDIIDKLFKTITIAENRFKTDILE